MKTVAQLLKHDFKSKGSLSLYDSNGNLIYHEYSYGFWYKRDYDSNNNCIYCENSTGFWIKYDYDSNGKLIYYENSYGYWYKQEFDDNGNLIYFEDSTGYIEDNRPKGSCNGKVVEIDGKRYQLKEFD
jgi:hypothetical protein